MLTIDKIFQDKLEENHLKAVRFLEKETLAQHRKGAPEDDDLAKIFGTGFDPELIQKILDKKNGEEGTPVGVNYYAAVRNANQVLHERNTDTQLKVFESLESALATYLTVHESLIQFGKLRSKEKDSPKSKMLQKEKYFINLFSLYAACAVGLKHLEKVRTETEFAEKMDTFDFSRKPEAVLKDIVQRLTYATTQRSKALGQDMNDKESVRLLEGFYTLLMNQVLFEKEKYEDLIEAYHLKKSLPIDGVVINGFTHNMAEKPKMQLQAKLEDVVGNEDFIREGKKLVENLLAYDFNHGKNPMMDFPQLLAAEGKSGTGKTFTSTALASYAQELSEKYGIPFEFVVMRRTDWASEYQNLSQKALLQLFNDRVFNADKVVLVYWPDFDTAFSARNSSDIRGEEKANLNVIFGLLDGTIGPKNGKWGLIVDFNYIPDDVALLSRVKQNQVKVEGPKSVEQYVTMIRDKQLRKVKDHLKLSEDEWQKVGEKCAEYGLTGRAIESISLQTESYITNFEKPEGFFTMTYEEKAKVRAERSIDVNFDYMLERVENYFTFEKAAEDRKFEERYKQEVENWKITLSSQSEAHRAVAYAQEAMLEELKKQVGDANGETPDSSAPTEGETPHGS